MIDLFITLLDSSTIHFWIHVGIPLVLGELTRDYTGTPCTGDVVSLTCTVPGMLLGWDIPDSNNDIVLDSGSELPFERNPYTVTSLVINSNITSNLIFPAMEGITIGCFPVGQLQLREELTIRTVGEVILRLLLQYHALYRYSFTTEWIQ